MATYTIANLTTDVEDAAPRGGDTGMAQGWWTD